MNTAAKGVAVTGCSRSVHVSCTNTIGISNSGTDVEGVKYEMIYQLDAIEFLFMFFQLDMFRAYTPIFRSNRCYNFFTYATYGVLGVVRFRS